MTLQRIGPLSAGKLCGVLYFVVGLFIGVIASFVGIIGAFAGAQAEGAPSPFFGLAFGIGAVFFLPVLYGSLGFLSGVIGSAIYNVAARFIGGIQIEITQP